MSDVLQFKMPLNVEREVKLSATLTKGQLIQILKRYEDDFLVQSIPSDGKGVEIVSAGTTLTLTYTKKGLTL